MLRLHYLFAVLILGLGCVLPTAECEAVPTDPAATPPAESRLLIPAAAVGPVEAHRDTTDADTTRADSRAERKSPGWALGRSLGGTVLLAPVFGIGLVVGPSFGHLYVDNDLQAGIGLGIRTIGGAVLVIGALRGAILGIPQAFFGDPDEIDTRGAGRLVGIGGGIVLASALVDIVTAPIAAKNYNEARGLTAQVTPAVGPGPGQVGLAVQVRF